MCKHGSKCETTRDTNLSMVCHPGPVRWRSAIFSGSGCLCSHSAVSVSGIHWRTGISTEPQKGLDFFKVNFFEETGRPKYYHTRTYPVDIQCAAQAVDTLARLSRDDPSSLDLAMKVAAWTIQNMQDAAGYFYYRQIPPAKSENAHASLGPGHHVQGPGRPIPRTFITVCCCLRKGCGTCARLN